jgi:dihydroorotase-like cyclic amidohydrolase
MWRRAAHAQRFIDLTSAGPQRVFALSARADRAGHDANFTVVDLKNWTGGRLARLLKLVAVEGDTLTGKAVSTIRGQRVMWEDSPPAALGEPVRSGDRLRL